MIKAFVIFSLLFVSCISETKQSKLGDEVLLISKKWCGSFDGTELSIFFKTDTTLNIKYNNPSKQTINSFDHMYSLEADTLRIEGKIPAQIFNSHDNTIRLKPLGDELRPDIDLIYVTPFSVCDSKQTD